MAALFLHGSHFLCTYYHDTYCIVLPQSVCLYLVMRSLNVDLECGDNLILLYFCIPSIHIKIYSPSIPLENYFSHSNYLPWQGLVFLIFSAHSCWICINHNTLASEIGSNFGYVTQSKSIRILCWKFYTWIWWDRSPSFLLDSDVINMCIAKPEVMRQAYQEKLR